MMAAPTTEPSATRSGTLTARMIRPRQTVLAKPTQPAVAGAVLVAAAVAVLIPLSPLGDALGSTALRPDFWLLLVGLGRTVA